MNWYLLVMSFHVMSLHSTFRHCSSIICLLSNLIHYLSTNLLIFGYCSPYRNLLINSCIIHWHSNRTLEASHVNYKIIVFGNNDQIPSTYKHLTNSHLVRLQSHLRNKYICTFQHISKLCQL